MKVIKVRTLYEVPQDYTGIVDCDDGVKAWYLNGRLHREDGPACEYVDGYKEWYLNGKLFSKEWTNGNKGWYLNDKLHREDGPAYEYADGSKHWYLNGDYHREDGPTFEDSSGLKQWRTNFDLNPESQPFILIEEINDGRQIKVLSPIGIEIWPNLPGLKQLADNWEASKP